MRHHAALLVTLLLLAAPVAFADPPSKATEGGLAQACGSSGNAKPCSLGRIIPETTVMPGETRTYEDGTYRAEGDIHVATGATLVVEDATIRFADTSGGILVDAGGALRIVRSELRDAGGSPYSVVLLPGSSLVMNHSLVQGGQGVDLRTSDVSVHENNFTGIPLALRLTDVTAVIHDNVFYDNVVSVNQTGGQPTLDSNVFRGGDVCVRDWLSDPVIVRNVFRGCHVGIFHHRSESEFRLNDMEDEAHEPGTGIVVKDTMSPFIEDNVIRNYGTGILVINARAFIRNNTIASNVLDGVRVVSNSAPMDVTNNTIEGNGRHGVHLTDAEAVVVQDNRLLDNGGTGLRVEGSAAVTVSGNEARGNGQDGFYTDSDGVAFSGNLAEANAHSGFVVESADDVTFLGDAATGNLIDGFGLVDAFATLLHQTESGANARHGYRILNGSRSELSFTNASANGLDGYNVDAPGGLHELDFARAFGNGRDGVRNEMGNATVATNGWWEGNAHAGVANLDPDVWTDARQSYWGSVNGPTVPDGDPEGGDAVFGNVLYEPYRESPPSSTPIFAVDVVG